jgi:hypothetical protein
MPAKPKTAVNPGKKAKSDPQSLLPKNDYSHLSNDMISDIGIGIHIIQKGKFVFVSPLLQKLSGYPKSTLLDRILLFMFIRRQKSGQRESHPVPKVKTER